MNYRITRNRNLVDLPEEFSAKNWDSALNKVMKGLQANSDVTRYAKKCNLSLEKIAWDMIVEIGKDY